MWTTREDGLGLRVRDDGQGFADATGTQHSATGGLCSIHHRAQALGGRCEIESAHGEGTTLNVTVPRLATF